MPEHKPLHVTSTTHAMALWTYGILAAIGLSFVLGWADRTILRELLHWPMFVTAWGLLWWVAGLVGLGAALIAVRVRPPDAAGKIRLSLIVEAFGAAGLVAALTVYLAAVWLHGQPGNQTLALIIGGGYWAAAATRVGQIIRERHLIAAAVAKPSAAEVLAAPLTDE